MTLTLFLRFCRECCADEVFFDVVSFVVPGSRGGVLGMRASFGLPPNARRGVLFMLLR